LTFPNSSASGILLNTAGALSWLGLGSLLSYPMTSLGDMVYGGLLRVSTRPPGNTTGSTKQFLTSTSTLGVAGAPAWGTIQAGDLPSLSGVAVTSIAGTANEIAASASTG